jgi:predicted dehydrogenase
MNPRRRKTGLTSAVSPYAAPLIVPSERFAAAPSDRVNVGIVGAGSQGFNLLRRFLAQADAQVIAVCDVNRASYGYADETKFLGREPAQQLVTEYYGRQTKSGTFAGCSTSSDFRELVGRKDIDAVAIATPDHWHGVMTIVAARAGKDIYCETPLSLTIWQGQQMVEAVRQHKRILQVGSQERSNPVTRFACALVRNGRIGELKTVTTSVGYNDKTGPGPGWKPQPVPEGFDYEMWLGPAPEASYHPDRCLGSWRFIYDYSGGQVTSCGSHSNDIAHWAMRTDDTGPVEIECRSAKFLPEGSLFDAATETSYRCRYASGVELICQTDRSSVGARFEGSEGTVQVGYGGLYTKPESLKKSTIRANEIQLYHSDDHVRNFLDCVRARREPAAPVDVGHRSACVCHLGTIAVRLWKEGKRKVLRWDSQNERFSNDAAANALLTRPMRAPWSI